MTKRMKSIGAAALAVALGGAALAAPLSEKDVARLVKECEKAAAQGKDDDATARAAELSRDNTALSTRALIDLATRVEGGRVYYEIVRLLAKTAGEGLATIVEEARSTASRERKIVIADTIVADPAGKEELVPLFMLDPDDVLARLMIQATSERLLKSGVEAAITLIERHDAGSPKRPEVAKAARRALKRVTGREFQTGRDYRNWWEPRKETWDPFEPDAGEGGTASREEPTFFGTEVVSSRVVIVVDISGSMAQKEATGAAVNPECKGHTFPKKDNCPACHVRPKGGDVPEAHPAHNHPVPPCICKGATVQRIDRARDELIALIESFREGTHFNVIAFNSQVQRWQKSAVRATKESKASACAWVKKLKESGFTETGKALEAAFEDPTVDTIYLLSDGAPERSAKEKIPTEPILRAVEKKNRFRKVKIICLGWGTIDEDFMRRLAEENGGHFEHVKAY